MEGSAAEFETIDAIRESQTIRDLDQTENHIESGLRRLVRVDEPTDEATVCFTLTGNQYRLTSQTECTEC